MFTFTKQNNNIIINYSRFYKYHELPTKKDCFGGLFERKKDEFCLSSQLRRVRRTETVVSSATVGNHVVIFQLFQSN